MKSNYKKKIDNDSEQIAFRNELFQRYLNVFFNRLILLKHRAGNNVFSRLHETRMMCYSVMTQAYSEKRNSEFSQQESNLRPSDY